MPRLPRRLASASPGLLAIVMLAPGCLRDVGLGPDVGPCAEYPAKVYTYGEIGIGRCLSGPADIAFLEADGQTWLAVANADPYRNFSSGSVLLIDWARVDLTAGRNPVEDLGAIAIATDPFVGGLGWIEERDLLLVSGRYSEGTRTQSASDELQVFDLSDPAAPVSWAEGGSLTLGADPQPIAVDAARDRAFVANLTDHTIAVLDTSTTPIAEVDVAPDASVGEARFEDALSDLGEPFGGSAGLLDSTTVIDPDLIPTDVWTLTWIDGTYRLWVPTPAGDDTSPGAGLSRLSTGGNGYVAGGLGIELDPATSGGIASEIRDPFLGFVEGYSVMYFSDDGVLRRVQLNPVDGHWDWSSARVVLAEQGGYAAWIGGASVVSVTSDAVSAYFEARESRDAAPSIGLATSTDGLTWRFGEAPIVSAPSGYLGVAQPFVRNDPFSNSLRMWVSLWDGTSWSIGLSESRDGETWSAVEPVLAVPGEDVAAPVVTWANGRYLMWATRGDGATWSHATAWSWDGRTWYDLRDAFSSAEAYDVAHPPRLALQSDPTGAWRIEGQDSGAISSNAFSGSFLSLANYGFAVRVASGYELAGDLLGDSAANGLEPGAYAEIDGVPTLYVTALDEALTTSIAALQWDGAEWLPVAEDLVPEGEGGNVDGAESPVITGTDGDWTMYYGAVNAVGQTRIRRATSSDGLSWTASADDVLPPAETWEAIAQIPHSVEVLEDGQIRLWYTGTAGADLHINSATGDGTSFELDPGVGDELWQLGDGEPGEWDDEGVAWPYLVTDGDTTHLYYAGTDGAEWHIGHAVREGDLWVRDLDPITAEPIPLLSGIDTTFSAGGVYAPVVLPDGLGGWQVWYAGTDGAEPRIGIAIGDEEALYPAHRFPTAGDQLVFSSRRGSEDTTVIDLDQTIDGFDTSGEGVSALVLDEERGFLYVPSKKTNYVYVVDVRDDSTGGYVDANYLDIEAILLVVTVGGPRGFRDVQPVPGSDVIWLTQWGPDALVGIDMAAVEDDDRKQSYVLQTVATLPLVGGFEDEGVPSFSGDQDVPQIAGADMALAADGRTLFVPHYQDNSVEVFDLGIGTWGQEIRRIPWLGENPHIVRFSPDGRYAVVANYVGEVDEGVASSTLVVIDADPASPTYLEPLTWITNR